MNDTSEEFRKYRAALGGKARAAKLGPDARSASSRRAALARWADTGEEPIRATHAGVIQIGDVELACANLPGGRRVISEAAVMTALSRGYSGYYSQRDAAADPSAAVPPRYLAPAVLKPFMSEELSSLQFIPYILPGSGAVAKGLSAEMLPKICAVWLKAREAGKLSATQLRTAALAEMLVLGLSETGIIALVDEATGYQLERPRRDLEKQLKKFLSKSLRKWVSTFPADYFKHLCRLRGVEFRSDMKLPQYFGTLTNNLVYRRFAPSLLGKLKERRVELGKPKEHLHTGLSLDIGVPELLLHLGTVIAVMKLHKDYAAFEKQLNLVAPQYPASPGLFDDPKDWEEHR